VQARSAILAGLQDMLPTMSTAGSVAGEPADSAVVVPRAARAGGRTTTATPPRSPWWPFRVRCPGQLPPGAV